MKKTRRMKELEKRHKKERRNKIIMSLVLAILMFGSIFGIWARSLGSEKIIYNDYKFKVQYVDEVESNVYVTKVDGKEIYLYGRPEVAMNLEVNGNLTDFFNKAMYVVFTNNNEEKISYVSDHIRYELTTLSQIPMSGALDKKYDNFDDYNVITCENASETMPVIYMKESNSSTQINLTDNCLNVDINFRDLAYVRDRLLLSALGVAEE